MAFPAFLDACTLIPINVTDVLLRLAEAQTYRPLWSAHVLDEVERNLPECDTNMTPEKAAHRVGIMRAAFLDAEVTNYEALIPSMTNHEKDRHVLAAAVRGGAALIVTPNLSDFPDAALQPYDVDAVHPDAFLQDQLDLYPEQTLACLRELVADRTRPPVTLDSFLTQLAKTVPKFCEDAHRRAHA